MENTRKFPLILSSFWLKIIALLTMTFDHVGYEIWYYNADLSYVFRYIGRLALPLFCFMIAEGAIHTKSFGKYAFRLGLMASIISIAIIGAENIPYIQSMRREGIIFVDLLLGAVAIFCLRQKKWYFKILAILPLAYGVASFIASSLEACGCQIIHWFPYFLRTQYDWFAILLIILFYVAHLLTDLFLRYQSNMTGLPIESYRDGNLERNALNIISVAMLALASALYYICGKMMPSQYIDWDLEMQLFAIVSGVFILLYNGRRGYNKKWFQYGSYLYYPVHMVIIYLIFMLVASIGG